MFIVRDDGTLVAMRASPFESESLFQTLLASHPSLLAGEAVNPNSPRRWLLIAREQAVPGEEGGAGRWSLDHLFVDQDGVPTLVEVKRASDTRGRREVVAQMLDYAANGVIYWPAEMLRTQFERACAADGREPDDAVRTLLASPEADAGAFWSRVDMNLRAGRIRMVFVADVIHPELKRIVEFLNAQMNPAEVIALELRHYSGPGLRTLVPRVIGLTAEAERRKGGVSGSVLSGPPPSVADWFSQFEAERGPEELALAVVIRDWWQAQGAEVGTTRSQRPSLFVKLTLGGRTGYPAFIKAGGRVTTGLYAVKTLPPYDEEDARRQLVATMAQATGLEFSDRAFDGEPSVPLARLRDPETLDAVLAIWSEFLRRARAQN
ncbi:hypothetical protein BHAOGJBA_0407 [Methylobacterium hispanicum]|uniref:Uncharacterized protein n=2 Tax=Methylobacteriaceae TaxID=119045 RepID=A0AAV4ZG56_9HYPH|nr:hypothetical protein BHAOGJBA_0407 [Methylobacterium hispanicum]